ncbi:phage terminase small subunit P27 family [Gellertiella hungarica]|uniref:P27 family predicted phage terminase small subunit n=1 Tax=Gellertiella hungarica TaxID=1572859 RepID=A0A7W6NKT2_9HYPH|nr:phage terminase small subunit P27 family [Gellertiella hungarica]MBB4064735.1 P27 family predicted phage terminase small subunit [Gellertiella hungarica]
MKGRKADLRSIDGGMKGVPRMPASVPADMRPEWNSVASDMVKREILTESMVGVLATYMIALWTVRQAQQAIAEHGLLTATAHGNLKPNPASGILSKALEQVSRLSAELGLTPAARSKQGFNRRGDPNDDGAPPGLDL